MTHILEVDYESRASMPTPSTEEDDFAVFRHEWASLGGAGIAAAYGDNEPEYSPEDVIK
ncbi:MAG: hypothetical protein ACKVY0_22200 [Prosthecobacter sp.]|uniref:hypothetical protein n=1 Tax=Prosthecobacter sp. TaxID=1965333 RepID=UPI003903B725